MGGGTKSRVWSQATSDTCNAVQMLREKTWGASFGDAFLAALATGHPERFAGYTSGATPTFEVTSDAPIDIGLDGDRFVRALRGTTVASLAALQERCTDRAAAEELAEVRDQMQAGLAAR